MANGSHVFCSVVHCGCNYKHNQMDNKVVYVLKARPESITKQMQQDEMLIKMEKQRQARQFPWKRKGYRKHVK